MASLDRGRCACVALCTVCLLGVFATSAFGATYDVTSTADDSGSIVCSPAPATCPSLRDAIDTIVGNPQPPDVINLAAGDYVLTNGTLFVEEDMTINGAGAGTGAGTTTIDGDGDAAFVMDGIDLNSSPGVTLSGMNVEDAGRSDDSPAIDFAASNTATLTLSDDAVVDNQIDDVDGAGVYFQDNTDPGALDITDTTIAGNTSTCCADGIGLAFENSGVGTLTIDGSTVSGNTGGTGDGGGLYFDGATATITNSTFSGNGGGGDGGGMYLSGGVTTLKTDTIADNTVASGDFGAGIYVGGTVTADNTIISGNTGGTAGHNDCSGPVTASDHSLENGTDCGLDLSGDPKPEALGDNGGPTQTMALSQGSAAIDAGDMATCPLVDQRGFPRPDVPGTACDVGAYESGGPPSASLTTPAIGATFTFGQVVTASYACSAGTDGTLKTGAAGCAAPVANGAAVNTSTVGSHSFTVTATDTDGQTDSVTDDYTVSAPPPPVNILPPSITGTPTPGDKLSCSDGAWMNSPTSYNITWSRNGAPIGGATGATYVVQPGDLGTTLTCTVTAFNAGGAGDPATSKGLAVPTPPGCPLATGSLTGQKLGLVKLGMTRAQARRAFVHSSNRGQKYQDFFCLTPIGVRVGYGSPRLARTLPGRVSQGLAERVVWISTANPYYALDGVRPGASLAAARKHLKLDGPIHLGINFWYFAPNGATTAVLKVRQGIVEEIGIAIKSLTIGRTDQRKFMLSFG